jgi:hypothetical protein
LMIRAWSLDFEDPRSGSGIAITLPTRAGTPQARRLHLITLDAANLACHTSCADLWFACSLAYGKIDFRPGLTHCEFEFFEMPSLSYWRQDAP